MSDWEPSYAVASIHTPTFQKQPGRYRVKTVALDAQPITTAGGITVLPHMTLDTLDPDQSAMLILPGGRHWEDGKNMDAAAKAKSFLAAGVPVAAICGATLGLARAGVLDLMRHTSNAPQYLMTTNYLGSALYQNEPSVTDGKLVTAGATGALEFARDIFRLLGVYSAETLDSWYGLFKTGNPAFFSALMQSRQGATTPSR